MTQEVKEEVERLLLSGERDEAIGYLRSTFNIGVRDATLLVETLEREMTIPESLVSASPPPGTSTTLDGPLKIQVAELLKSGRQSEAIGRVRQELNLGLKDALILIGEVAREQNPNTVSVNLTGCVKVVAKGLGVFLMVTSLIFLGVAVFLYFYQAQSIADSERVEGTVTEMRSLDTGESAPVIEFEWQGSKRLYASTFYSSPPDYYKGQELFLFVNREDPEDITLDTFAARWALIVGLSVPGAFFLLISIIILHFARRKF